MLAEVNVRVAGGTTYVLRAEPLAALQSLAATTEGGPVLFRRFLRLAPGRGAQQLTPVAAGILLQAVTLLPAALAGTQVHGVAFCDRDGRELGRQYSHGAAPLAAGRGVRLAADAPGIRVETDALPPPAGFRAGTGDHYCHFRRLERDGEGWRGERSQGAGSGHLDYLPLPAVARWDTLNHAGTEPEALIHCHSGADAVYRDLLAALNAACTEALRLPALLIVQRA